jgi:hypothetical protein
MIDFLRKTRLFIENASVPLFPIGLIIAYVLYTLDFYVLSIGFSHFLKVLCFLGVFGWSLGISRQRNDLIVMLQVFLIAILGGLLPITVTKYVILGIVYVTIVRKGSSRYKWLKRFVYISLIFILLVDIPCTAIFDGFVSRTKVTSIGSPNGNYNLNLWDFSAGATGGSTSVFVERNYGNVLKHTIGRVYRGKWGDHPELQWIDNEHIAINGKTIDITKIEKE